jgi:hypothetical protein
MFIGQDSEFAAGSFDEAECCNRCGAIGTLALTELPGANVQ